MNTPLAHTSPVAPVYITSSASTSLDLLPLAIVGLVAFVILFTLILILRQRVSTLEGQMADVMNAVQVNKDNLDYELHTIKSVLNTNLRSETNPYRDRWR